MMLIPARRLVLDAEGCVLSTPLRRTCQVRWIEASYFAVGKGQVRPVISETAPGLPVIYDGARRVDTKVANLHTSYAGRNSRLPAHLTPIPRAANGPTAPTGIEKLNKLNVASDQARCGMRCQTPRLTNGFGQECASETTFNVKMTASPEKAPGPGAAVEVAPSVLSLTTAIAACTVMPARRSLAMARARFKRIPERRDSSGSVA